MAPADNGEDWREGAGDDDSVMADAQSVLENLLDVVKSERNDIIASAAEERDKVVAEARSTAESEAARIRQAARVDMERAIAEGRRQAEALLNDARRTTKQSRQAFLDIVHAALDQLGQVGELRQRLEEIGQTLSEDVTGVESQAYAEVDPTALQTLADELGEAECRDVIGTFLSEMMVQLDDLRRALSAGTDESRSVSRTLHNLSSGCATVGATALAGLCRSLTVAMLQDRFSELERRAHVVRSEVARIRDNDLTPGASGSLGVGEDSGEPV